MKGEKRKSQRLNYLINIFGYFVIMTFISIIVTITPYYIHRTYFITITCIYTLIHIFTHTHCMHCFKQSFK